MTWKGWLFMAFAWSVIIALFSWCFYKVLTLPVRGNRGGSQTQD